MSKAAFSRSSLSALKRHSWVALSTFISVLVGATAISLAISPRLYQTSVRLIVGQKEVGISSLGQELTAINTQVPGRAADPVATQAELVQSQNVLRGSLEQLQNNGKTSVEKLPDFEELKQAIKVEIVPATSILQVNYKNTDPVVAAEILNAIANLVITENTKLIRSEASSIRQFLEKKIPPQQARLRTAEAAERKFQETYSLVASANQTENLIASLTFLENQERELRAQLQEARQKDQSLQKITGLNTSTEAYIAGRIGQDEQLKQIQKELTSLEVEISEANSRWTEQHPQLLGLLQKRDQLRAIYNQQLLRTNSSNQTIPADQVASNQLSQDLMSRYIISDIERQGLENKLRVVQNDLESLRSRVGQIPSSQESLRALTRERERAETALKLLEDKLEEARIAEGQILSNIRILGSAEIPKSPVSPRPLVILVLSTVISIIAAGAIVLILELMDSTFRDAAEVEVGLDIPVLAVLPKFTPATSNVAELDCLLDNPEQIEPYRMLLKTIESLGTQKPKIIVFSSVNPGEGKSAVALHLAAVAGMLSRRTLIINADFQYPIYHNLLNVPASAGLTEVVSQNLPLLDAVKSTSIPNFSVLLSGKTHHRPSMIIETVSMKTVLAEAAQHYDYVIVDASAINNSADAITLSQFADGIVLVIKPNSTSRDAALQAISDLRKSGISILGVVMNETVLPLEKQPSVLSPSGDKWELPVFPRAIHRP